MTSGTSQSLLEGDSDMRSYYNSKAPQQMQGILTRPAVGINEYTPPNALNDNYLSNAIDVEGYREEAIRFYRETTVYKMFSVQGLDAGRIVAAYESENSDSTNGDYQFYGMAIKTTSWYLFVANYVSVGISTLVPYTMTMPSIPSYNSATGMRFNKAIFRTEGDVFYCFTCDYFTRLHYLKYNYEKGTDSYGYVDLPFYPASMVSHANRIFAIDTRNKLWWCRAGDLFSWYSLEYDDDRLMASANMKNGAHTLTGTIDTPRVFTATCTTTNTADTRGILTIVGTNSLGNAQTATLTLYEGRVQTPEVWATITSVTQSGWTQGGATPDTIQLGVGPVGSGYIQDDAGYWTLENERYVFELFTLSNVLYISAGDSIYAFRGYSYETFSLQKLISNLGNPGYVPFGYKTVAIIRNRAYFISGNNVYEFDGDSSPRIISYPVYVNNALTNGIMGGIDMNNNLLASNYVMEADKNYLYLYSRSSNMTMYYMFDFQTRTWWKKSGWSIANFNTTDSMRMRMIPKYGNNGFIPFFWTWDTGVTEDDFWFCFGVGATGVTQTIGGVARVPYIITKAFQSLPSETGTLTSIILALKGTQANTADITVGYSLAETGDTFTTIWTYNNYAFSGDKEIIEIPVPVSYIANAHHYRLRIQITDFSSSNPVYLYNIERRFRVRGYSR